jgi:hypothetical protein
LKYCVHKDSVELNSALYTQAMKSNFRLMKHETKTDHTFFEHLWNTMGTIFMNTAIDVFKCFRICASHQK